MPGRCYEHPCATSAVVLGAHRSLIDVCENEHSVGAPRYCVMGSSGVLFVRTPPPTSTPFLALFSSLSPCARGSGGNNLRWVHQPNHHYLVGQYSCHKKAMTRLRPLGRTLICPNTISRSDLLQTPLLRPFRVRFVLVWTRKDSKFNKGRRVPWHFPGFGSRGADSKRVESNPLRLGAIVEGHR